MKSLAERLNLAMEMRGIRYRKELADMAGVSPGAVTQWFTGDVSSLGADTLMRLSRGLRVRPEWLNQGRGPVEGDGQAEEVREEWPFSFSVAAYKSLPESDQQELEAIVKMKLKRHKLASTGSAAGSARLRGGEVRMEEALKTAPRSIGGTSDNPSSRKVKRN